MGMWHDDPVGDDIRAPRVINVRGDHQQTNIHNWPRGWSAAWFGMCFGMGLIAAFGALIALARFADWLGA